MNFLNNRTNRRHTKLSFGAKKSFCMFLVRIRRAKNSYKKGNLHSVDFRNKIKMGKNNIFVLFVENFRFL